jgi:hypothetical protein
MRDLSRMEPLAARGATQPGYEYLIGRGVPEAALDTVIPMFDLRYDEDTRRVVFPVREAGVDLGYAARSIDARERKRWLSYPVEGGHRNVVYEPDRVRAGGDTLFIVEGPFDALMVMAALARDNPSVATAFFGSQPTERQLDYIRAAIPLYRRVFLMLDANVWGRCRVLAHALGVGAINIGVENRDPGATRFVELQQLVAYASTSRAAEIRWMWERRLALGGTRGA